MANPQLECTPKPLVALGLARAEARTALLATPNGFFLVLAGYFGLHVLLRGLASETAGIDDVDQIPLAACGWGPRWWETSFLMQLHSGTSSKKQTRNLSR